MPTPVTAFTNVLQDRPPSPLNKSGDHKLSQSEDGLLRAARLFSTSPKAEGDQIEEFRNNFKDITIQLNEVEAAKQELENARIENLIELYRAAAADAPNKIELTILLQKYISDIDLSKCANKHLAYFLFKMSNFIDHEELDLYLLTQFIAKAQSITANLKLKTLANEIAKISMKIPTKRYEELNVPFDLNCFPLHC